MTTPALVLGSAQPLELVDERRCAEAGIEVTRRRSGGGALLVAPGAQVWVDCYVPSTDPLAERDVGLSFLWLGECWRAALARAMGHDSRALEVTPPGGGARTRLARTLCWAGLGSGEVTASGRKVVGLSSKRDRRGAWFHAMVPLAGCETSLEVPQLLRLDEEEREVAAASLRDLAGAVAVAGAVLEEAFLEELALVSPPGEAKT